MVFPSLAAQEDDAMRAFAGEPENEGAGLDSATNARLLKTTDRNLMPVCFRVAQVSVMGLS